MRHSMKEQALVAFIFMAAIADTVVGLRVNVTVPAAVTSGSNATIVCDHDLDSDNVYTVKWYKSGHEFFRYTPREFPALKLFWLPGIKVDLEESNATHVQLKKVSPKQTGRYSCEVSADAPSFDTKLVSADLEVVVLPTSEPIITGVKEQYQAHERLLANCTSNGSIPSAMLEWKINNVPANPFDIIKYDVIKDADTKLETRTIGLDFPLPPFSFVKGKLMLQCSARIHDLYSSEVIKFIEEDRPQVYSPSVSFLSGDENNRRNVMILTNQIIYFKWHISSTEVATALFSRYPLIASSLTTIMLYRINTL